MRTAIRREISSSSASMSAAVPRYRSEIIFGRPSTQPISRRYQYGFPLITFLYRLAISLGHRIFRGKRQGDTPDCRRPGLTGDVRQLIKIEIARKLGLGVGSPEHAGRGPAIGRGLLAVAGRRCPGPGKPIVSPAM